MLENVENVENVESDKIVENDKRSGKIGNKFFIIHIYF